MQGRHTAALLLTKERILKHSSTVILKLTHAIVIAGQVVGTGRLVEVTRREAVDLLNRGKAVVYEGDIDGDEDVPSSGGSDTGLHPDIEAINQAGGQVAQDGQEGASDGTDTEASGNASRGRGGRSSKQK